MKKIVMLISLTILTIGGLALEPKEAHMSVKQITLDEVKNSKEKILEHAKNWTNKNSLGEKINNKLEMIYYKWDNYKKVVGEEYGLYYILGFNISEYKDNPLLDACQDAARKFATIGILTNSLDEKWQVNPEKADDLLEEFIQKVDWYDLEKSKLIDGLPVREQTLIDDKVWLNTCVIKVIDKKDNRYKEMKEKLQNKFLSRPISDYK